MLLYLYRKVNRSKVINITGGQKGADFKKNHV